MIQASRRDAAQILSAARRKARTLRLRAYQKGRNQAQQGASAAEFTARSLRHAVLTQLQGEILDLVFSLLSTLVGEQLVTQPGAIEARVRNAISTLVQRDPIRIEANPEDAPYLQHFAADRDRQNGVPIEIRSDTAIPRGSARLTTGQISLDLFPHRHLQRLRSAIAGHDILCRK